MSNLTVVWLLSMTMIILTPISILFGVSYVDAIVVEMLNVIILLGTQQAGRQ